MAIRKQRRTQPAATPQSPAAASKRRAPYNIYRELRIPEGSLPEVSDPDLVELLHRLCRERRPDTERAQRTAIWWALSVWQELRAEEGGTEGWQLLNESKACADPAERNALDEAGWKQIRAWGRLESYAQKAQYEAMDAWQEWTGAMPLKRKTRLQRELDAMEQRAREALGDDYREPMFPPVRTRLDAWRETFIRQALLRHFQTGATDLAAKGGPAPALN